jgi:hypothetical protein
MMMMMMMMMMRFAVINYKEKIVFLLAFEFDPNPARA